jgi:TRAP-type C4-dicarboxylate transport system substrate-binding protein
MNFDEALAAFQEGKVDGQENPIALIIPYKLWAVHNYITLWDYAIDPLILAVSGKTWATLSADDRSIVRQVGAVMMELQKDEARNAPVKPAKLVQLLQTCMVWRWLAPPRLSLMHSAVKPVLSMRNGRTRSEWI